MCDYVVLMCVMCDLGVMNDDDVSYVRVIILYVGISQIFFMSVMKKIGWI